MLYLKTSNVLKDARKCQLWLRFSTDTSFTLYILFKKLERILKLNTEIYLIQYRQTTAFKNDFNKNQQKTNIHIFSINFYLHDYYFHLLLSIIICINNFIFISIITLVNTQRRIMNLIHNYHLYEFDIIWYVTYNFMYLIVLLDNFFFFTIYTYANTKNTHHTQLFNTLYDVIDALASCRI